MELADVVQSRKAAFGRNLNRFHEVFGVPLRNYWHPLLGFDVIAFDEKFICPPDGTSTKQAVEAKYGAQGVEIVMDLLGV